MFVPTEIPLAYNVIVPPLPAVFVAAKCTHVLRGIADVPVISEEPAPLAVPIEKNGLPEESSPKTNPTGAVVEFHVDITDENVYAVM